MTSFPLKMLGSRGDLKISSVTGVDNIWYVCNMTAREGISLAGTSTTLWNDITKHIKQTPMAMLSYLCARTAHLQPSILVGVVLRAVVGSKYTYQCYFSL